MPVSRTITYGFGSWVGSYSTLTQIAWWPQDPATLSPAYDVSKQINSDLARNLQAVRNGQISVAQIDVDDAPLYGGETKVGATFPGGTMIQGCWMEKGRYDALTTNKPGRIPANMQCRDYELTTVWYWNGTMANRRFWGFYGEITSETSPTSAQVAFWPAGKSLDVGQGPAVTAWMNFTTQVHPPEAGFTVIQPGLGKPKHGAIFIDAVTRGTLGLTGPKLPPGMGSNVFPRVR
jgi:hypothetical protein